MKLLYFLNKINFKERKILKNQNASLVIRFYVRTMPGPPVVVCQGDEVLVDVYNHLNGDSTSIHFHGIQTILMIINF